MTEKQLQAAVVQLAKLTGHLVYHTHDSRRSEKGFPDLVMVRGNTALFIELKSEKGRPTTEQKTWLGALTDVTRVVTDIWYPSDWQDGSIETLLRGEETA